MSQSVVFTLGSFAEGFCWESPQQFAAALVAILSGTVAGSAFVMGNALPDAADRDKPWFRLDASGNPDRWYKYNGAWLAPHPIPPSSNQIIIWKGTEAALWAFDGGDGTDPAGGGTAPTETTGAMWQRDTDFNFRMPIGIGTNGTSYNGGAATTIAVGDTGGEEKHVLTDAEVGNLISHKHVNGRMESDAGSGADDVWLLTGTPTATGAARGVSGAGDSIQNGSIQDKTGEYLVSGAPTGLATPNAHQGLPPYLGVVFAKRTARRYFTVS